jgi:predicted NBD/HSP70 family sugar kinase
LADRNGLSRAAVTIIVQELIAEGLIREIEGRVKRVGRPAVLLELNPQAACIIGVEISTGYVAARLTDLTAEPVWQERIVVSAEQRGSDLLTLAEGLVETAIARAQEAGGRLLGIGLVLPGQVDTAEGTLVEAAALGLTDVPLAQRWRARFSLPVHLENEANAAAVGESLLGHAREASSLLYVSIGGGVGAVVGASLMLNGELWRGAHGLAGAVGHMVLDPDGPPCSCGRRGCWQAMTDLKHEVSKAVERLGAGQESTLQRFAVPGYRGLTPEAIHEAAVHGDALAQEIVRETATAHARGIANLVAAFDPQLVVVGGSSIGLTEEARRRVAALQQMPELAFDALLQQAGTGRCEIRMSAHGSGAGLVGAVSVVLSAFLENPSLTP